MDQGVKMTCIYCTYTVPKINLNFCIKYPALITVAADTAVLINLVSGPNVYNVPLYNVHVP